MGIYKTLPLLFATILVGYVSAQETSDPVAAIITSDSEATGVLGGGWPPQNFGKSVGSKTVKDILNGARENGLKITDTASPAPDPKHSKMAKPEPVVKKADPKLIAESSKKSTDDVPPVMPIREEAAVVAAPQPTAPSVPEPKPFIISKPLAPAPAKIEEPKQAPSVLVENDPIPTPLILPPLPEVVDVVTPAITAATDRQERPERPRVRSLYTLGAGDTVSFSTFDRADLARTVRIAPDGTVSYLQAVAVNANGLTVDELRDRMEDELKKFRRDFKLIVSPQELRSKEFAILGRVRTPGTFPLDRPTSVLEGIALAEGVEIGTIRGSAYGLADFGKSFVSRNGRKLDVNFSKLYHEGDLSQNVYLQPNDYLYIASVLKNEFFILGAVNNPGRVKMPDQITVAKAIALSGGFQKEAYRMNVLVIRGDINNPNVEVVNLRDVLRGEARDIVVEPGDIIFVAQRPFVMVERVLDSAITTYVQTVTAEAINLNYTPIIN